LASAFQLGRLTMAEKPEARRSFNVKIYRLTDPDETIQVLVTVTKPEPAENTLTVTVGEIVLAEPE
jgi:hypothetical protein